MLAFYLTCLLFVFGVLGALLRVVAGVSIFKLVRYLAREYLLIVATSSSESALPRLIAKMEHARCRAHHRRRRRADRLLVQPRRHRDLPDDGVAVHRRRDGQAAVAREQISLLVFMIIASKGAAGVTGAGLATLAGGLQSHRPDLLDGVGLIVGIDRFMSEARALSPTSPATPSPRC